MTTDSQHLSGADSQDSMLRALPSVHDLVETQGLAELAVPRASLVEATRCVLERVRTQLLAEPTVVPSLDDLQQQVLLEVDRQMQPILRPLINATGIILHTGLGRAPLAATAVQALLAVADQYASVELNLQSGERGQRVASVEPLLGRLTGAESAIVVNNNAAATLLVLAAIAGPTGRRPGHVIVSRGELIEIGGSYRLPQIMQTSGAALREVGTTNKTHLRDYEEAIDEQTSTLLKVHTSNYRVTGFAKSVSIEPLVQLGHRHDLPVVHDIGSGAMVDFASMGLEGEPIVGASIAHGADLVLFSGDKLLGGPQAGIVVGRRPWIDLLRSHPMMRAVRVDKLTLAALEATLRVHLDPQAARQQLPVMAMINTEAGELRHRAAQIATALPPACEVEVRSTTSCVGGGSMPTEGLPSFALCIRVGHLSEAKLAKRLRCGEPPVIGRVHDGEVWLDLRTVFEGQDKQLAAAIAEASRK